CDLRLPSCTSSFLLYLACDLLYLPLSFSCYVHLRPLHSFPTRRSSDLSWPAPAAVPPEQLRGPWPSSPPDRGPSRSGVSSFIQTVFPRPSPADLEFLFTETLAAQGPHATTHHIGLCPIRRCRRPIGALSDPKAPRNLAKSGVSDATSYVPVL